MYRLAAFLKSLFSYKYKLEYSYYLQALNLIILLNKNLIIWQLPYIDLIVLLHKGYQSVRIDGNRKIT